MSCKLTEEKVEKIVALLQEMRDAQVLALERQARQIEISEKMMALAVEQYEKASHITNRAEIIQDKGLKAIKWIAVLGCLLLALLVIR